MRIHIRSLSLATVLLVGGTVSAQVSAPPPPGAPAPRLPMARAADAQQITRGQVQRVLVNPMGDVDGLLLADGQQVTFPPQAPDRLVLKAGDRVDITGWQNPEAKVISASAIKRDGDGRSLLDDAPPPPADTAPPPPKPGPVGLTAISTSGSIARMLYTDRGDANGVLLDSGVVVRFPPHVGQALHEMLAPGRSLSARGWGTRTALGTSIEANALGATEASMQDVLAGPAGMGGPGPGMPSPRTRDSSPAS